MSLLEKIFKKLDELKNQGKIQLDVWLDVSEAAAYLKMKKANIYKLSSKGKIPVHKKGKKLLFSKCELYDWVMLGRASTVEEIRNRIGL